MKRFLSMLLVLVMVFSMVPQAAFADENVGEEIAPVAEKAEYVYNYEYIVAGDNAITLDPSAVTTIFCFEPTEADGEGTYSFTAEGAVVGNWGGSEWFLFNPGTTGNSVEWKCTGIGQSVYIGVSGVDSCTLTVSKVSEETGLIEWS